MNFLNSHSHIYIICIDFFCFAVLRVPTPQLLEMFNLNRLLCLICKEFYILFVAHIIKHHLWVVVAVVLLFSSYNLKRVFHLCIYGRALKSLWIDVTATNIVFNFIETQRTCTAAGAKQFLYFLFCLHHWWIIRSIATCFPILPDFSHLVIQMMCV